MTTLGALPDLRGVRVFAVDDHTDTVEAVRALLELAGAHVECADSAAAALASPALAAAHVLISDLAMPGMTGFELMAAVRARPAEEGGRIPAIALSAYDNKAVEARAAGFSALLPKPCAPAQLIEMVALLAGGGQADDAAHPGGATAWVNALRRP